MERIVCKSCGGALVKIRETTYRCTHCGTSHELGRDDSQAVHALLERNNERWIYINRLNTSKNTLGTGNASWLLSLAIGA